MKNNPKISIVTPSFNQGCFLERTILSVLEQDYPNIEYIVIDGGSSDGSIEIIKKYETQLAYWISEPDRGQSHAINKGFERATGDIFGWLNSDDWLAKDALHTVAEMFGENPESMALVGGGEMIDEEGKPILHVNKSSITLTSLYNWNEEFFWQPSCFFTRRAWETCGPLDIDLHYAMDLDLWIKIQKKYGLATTDRLLSFSSKHPRAKTVEFKHLSMIEAYWVIMKHGGETAAKKGIERYVNQLSAAISSYEQSTRELSDMKGSLLDRVNSLEEYSEHLQQRIASQMRDHKEEVSRLKARIDLLTRDVDESQERNEILVECIADYERTVSELHMKTQSLWENIIDKERRIDALQNSISWTITRPLRMFVDILYNLRSSIRNKYEPKIRLIINILLLFMKNPIRFLRSVNYRTVSAFAKQFNRLDPNALEYEVRRKLLPEYEKPVDYFALFHEQADERKILVIDRFIPAHDTNSGALRMFTILNILNDLGYNVTFMPDNLSPKEPYVTELTTAGIQVLCGDINIEEYFINHGPKFRFVLLSEALPAYNFMAYVRAYAVNATVIYDTVDLHWVRLERSAAISGSGDVKREAEYFKKIELFNIALSDVVITVTHDEKVYLENINPLWNVKVIPNIHQLEEEGTSPFDDRKDIMFIGHYLHDPNVDAVKYFVKDIYPIIKKALPGVIFYIVGSNPVKDVMDLKSEDIEVTGYVKDVSPFFRNCRVFVSPLRFGAGMKGKIGQSMTYGLPVVTTSIGAEGMGLVDRKDVLIADSATDFAESVVELYNNKSLWNQLSQSSMIHIDSHYSKGVVSDIVAEILESL